MAEEQKSPADSIYGLQDDLNTFATAEMDGFLRVAMGSIRI
jgi:hypothetical protein